MCDVHCPGKRMFELHRHEVKETQSSIWWAAFPFSFYCGLFNIPRTGGGDGVGGVGEERRAFSRVPYHQSAHSLLLDPLGLFLLLPFGVGVPRGHCFGKLLDLPGHRAMVLLKIFCMLQNTVQVFLKDPKGSRKEYLKSISQGPWDFSPVQENADQNNNNEDQKPGLILG